MNSRHFILWGTNFLWAYYLNTMILIFLFKLWFFLCLFALWWEILFVLLRNLHLIWSMILILGRGKFLPLALLFVTKLFWLSLNIFTIFLVKRTSESIVKFNFRLAIDKNFWGWNWDDFSDLRSYFSFLCGT